MNVFVVLAMLLINPPAAAVITLDGNQQSTGSLISISESAMTIEVDSKPVEIPVKELMTVQMKGGTEVAATAAEKSPQHIELFDGSRIPCQEIARSAQAVTATTNGVGSVSIPVQAVKAMLLLPADEKYQGQWQTYLQRETKKDLLIVPKRDGDGLDFLAGIVSTITAGEISFLLDGDTIPVPAARVYGVIFADNRESRPTSNSLVQTTSEQLFGASAITFQGDVFQVRASWGQQLSVPQEQLRSIDFSVGRIRYLSDLSPLKETFGGIDPDGSLFTGLVEPTTLQLMYGPRRDTTIDTEIPIRLRGRKFAKGLCVHSRTELVYALDRRYTVFEAQVGIDDQVASNQDSIVTLTISGDGKQLFHQNIRTVDAALALKIPVQDTTTLTILVDYGDNDSSCDWLDLADAKLILATEDK